MAQAVVGKKVIAKKWNIIDVTDRSMILVTARTVIEALDEYPTKECFKTGYYVQCDSDFDELSDEFPVNQIATSECSISALSFCGFTLIECVNAVFGISGETNTVALGKFLINREHTMTLSQIEEIVRLTKTRTNTGLSGFDFTSNFFFVETGNVKKPVSVVNVSTHENGGWRVNLHDFLDDKREGEADRLFLNNLNLSNIG